MIVWLVSYPKSGNTWMRVLLTNYRRDADEPADVNALDGAPIAAARLWFDEWAGVEASCLPQHLVDRLRPDVYRCLVAGVDDTIVMKTHDAWSRTDTGAPLFPPDITRGVIYVVRNALDVAPSFAHHMNVDLDTAVTRMCDPAFTLGDASGNQLLQRLGTWADHVTSWLDDAELPVEVVSYEDLHAHPVATLRRVVRFLGWDEDDGRLARAVAHSSFDVLQAQEAEAGFRERAPHAASFFRRGETGTGELTPAQRARLVGVLGDTMVRLGYELPHYDHDAFGLVWRTPFYCPGLRDAPGGASADVVVQQGPVPTALDDAVLTHGQWQAAPDRYLFKAGAGVGRFLIEHGEITWQRTQHLDAARAARVFTDRLLYMTLQQRGYLVLHANAAAVDGEAVVIAGESGAGKSTTLAALLAGGAKMLCDDVCAITLDDAGRAVVLPGIAQYHLTEDSADGLGLNFGDYTIQPWRRMKAAVPAPVTSTPEAPTPLRSITVLEVGDQLAERALAGHEKLNALLAAVYGPLFADQHPGAFPIVTAVVAATPMRIITRSVGEWSVDDIAESVLSL